MTSKEATMEVDTMDLVSTLSDTCYISELPSEVLCSIFSYFSCEERFMALQFVCKQWMDIIQYPEWRTMNLSQAHRLLCRRGTECQIESKKRYSDLFATVLNRFLVKALRFIHLRCSTVVADLDISGLWINSVAATLILKLDRLESLNISKCQMSPAATVLMSKLHLDKLTMDGSSDKIGDHLTSLNVRQLCLNSTQSVLPTCLTSLKVRYISDATDVASIFDQCTNLNGFHVESGFRQISSHVVDVISTGLRGANLTSLTISLNPSCFATLCSACPRLVHLNFKSCVDRQVETNISCILSLKRLESFELACRRLSEHKFLNVIVQCITLKRLVTFAKNTFDFYSYFPYDTKLTVLPKLEVLKLTLGCVKRSTTVANFLVSVSPNLTNVRIMKNELKKCYNLENTINDEAFCVEYCKTVTSSTNLNSVTLPFMSLKSNKVFLHQIAARPISKLTLYGGNFHCTSSLALAIPTFVNLHTLVLGPYFHTLSGIDDLVRNMPYLRRLSVHVNCGSCWSLLAAVGSLEQLKRLDLRSCSSYFMERLEVEMITLMEGRQGLKRNKVFLSPLLMNIWSWHSTYFSLPQKLASEFDSLSIRFKAYYAP